MMNILKDEHCGDMMKSIYETLKTVINEKKSYAGIHDKETISAFIKLIVSVLEVCNGDVSVMALKCLKFLVLKLNPAYFATHCNLIYGVILRTLNYK